MTILYNSINDIEQDDGHQLSASEINSYLSRVLYNRRSKVNPLWNQLITAGFEEGKRYHHRDTPLHHISPCTQMFS